MDTTVALLGQRFKEGVCKTSDLPDIVKRIKELADVNTTFEGTRLVHLYLMNASWVTVDIIKAFAESGVDWNERHLQNTCLHWIVSTPVTWTDSLLEIIDAMLKSGANPMLKNSSGDNVVVAAIKRGCEDKAILSIVRTLTDPELMEGMDVISLLFEYSPNLPLETLDYLTTSRTIKYTPNHLEALLNYPQRRTGCWPITRLILFKLALTPESVSEVKRRRPQLLVDVAKMLFQDRIEYGPTISHLSATFNLNINYWSAEHGSILSHLTGRRDRGLENSSITDQLVYAIKMHVDDVILLPIVQNFPDYNTLNKMNVLNLMFVNYARSVEIAVKTISMTSIFQPITVRYPINTITCLVNNPYVKVNCDHLETFLKLDFWEITNLILRRLASTPESILEVKTRRPQLPIDVAKILSKTDLDYGLTIQDLVKTFSLDINHWFEDLGMPLSMAYLNSVENVDLDVLKAFADLSIDWNVVDCVGGRPLHFLVAQNKQVTNGTLDDAIRVLTGSGAKLELTDSQGNNVLHVAMSSSLLFVQSLLLGNSDPKQLINARNAGGESCLTLVLKQLRTDWPAMLKFLINCGADVHQIDYDGNNFLHLAFIDVNRDFEVLKKVVNVLANSGLDMDIAINQKNKSNHVPFYYAIKALADFDVLVQLIPTEDVLMENKNWDGKPVIEYVMGSMNNRTKTDNLGRLVEELLLRGANRSSPNTLKSLIASRIGTLELFELAILIMDRQTSMQDLDLAIEMRRVEFLQAILENANQELVVNLRHRIPNIIKQIVNVLMEIDSEPNLIFIFKLLIEKFGIDINCVTDDHGAILNNLIELASKPTSRRYHKVLTYVVALDNLDINKIPDETKEVLILLKVLIAN